MTRSHSASQDANSFITGFTLGLFAGAAGYYLFATDRGKKLRHHLTSEWDAARVELAKEGVLDRPNVSLREFVNEIVGKAVNATSGRVGQGNAATQNTANGGVHRKHMNRTKQEPAELQPLGSRLLASGRAAAQAEHTAAAAKAREYRPRTAGVARETVKKFKGV